MLSIRNKRSVFLLFTVVLAMGSCTKKLDTNTKDPNGVAIAQLGGKDVFGAALLATITNKIGANVSLNFPGDNFDYGEEWMGYWSRNSGYSASGEGAHIEVYALIYSDANSIWQSLYHNIFDYNFVMANSAANSILPGAARVMRTMVFQDLTDQFGNIPYAQATQPSVSSTPAYDSAAAIYKDLVVQVDSAITEINASSSTGDDASDIMFKGSKSLWLAFANTIKLRLLLRQVPNVYAGNSGYITTELSNVTAQGGFLGAGQDALINPGFVDASEQQNPFWGDYGYEPGSTSSTYQNFNYYGANTIIIDTLQSTGDPRIGYFFNSVSGGGYLGNPLGSPLVGASQFGKGLLQSPSSPALLFSASQSFFMQAEAVQRGMMSGDAAALFKQGVEESFRYLGLTVSAADAFIAGSSDPGVNFAVSTNPLGTILNQKWVAECGLDGLEAYADYRRTGYPVIYSPAATGVPQQRLLYPETEYTLNSTNVNAQNENSQSATAIPLFWALQ